MRPFWIVIVAAAVPLGCGSPPEPTAEDADPTPALPGNGEGASAAQTTVSRMELTMHDYSPTLGEERRPTFRVFAESASSADQKAWTIEGVRAVAEAKDQEPYVFAAAKGMFDQANSKAELIGGVELTSGPVSVTMEDVVWDDATSTARTDKPITFRDSGTELIASSFEVRVKEQAYVLTEPRGRFALGARRP